jgi:hypothetical protein
VAVAVSSALHRPDEHCYTQDVFDCPAKLGRTFAANVSFVLRFSPVSPLSDRKEQT